MKYLALALLVTTLPALAADAEAGKAKAVVCAACHGVEGKAMIPGYPHLAGQSAQYTAKQLKAFRDGQRQDPVMAPMAKPLSDADIENLAAWYASLKP
ncbi:cytochrome c [Aeromonas schubertii]|uniref:c-type cytochrome n=1 Tax=Aeromonas TaxID=642 RepID=UPI00067ED78D|nr:cytochrome c [Aeromonas schubertii]KUE78566.1 cytochrome C [Aeromonas schubertii]MBZ6072735.1 cytochrome c [Aeromonas schubertii]